MNKEDEVSVLDDDIDIEPGVLLEKVLKDIFKVRSEASSFVHDIDNAFSAEGDFESFVYDSAISYVIRRLINTGDFLRRQLKKEIDMLGDSEKEDFDFWGVFHDKLRQFLKRQTRFDESSIEKIIAVLVPCIRTKNQSPKVGKVKKSRLISKQTQVRGEIRCYICGLSLTKEDVIAEHFWPKSFGGTKSLGNLRVACNNCNGIKENHIKAADFHYERISFSSLENEKSFVVELNKLEFCKIALWAKSDYGCTVCGKKAEEVGRLGFTRKNPDDSWHFINIDAICFECQNILEREE